MKSNPFLWMQCIMLTGICPVPITCLSFDLVIFGSKIASFSFDCTLPSSSRIVFRTISWTCSFVINCCTAKAITVNRQHNSISVACHLSSFSTTVLWWLSMKHHMSNDKHEAIKANMQKKEIHQVNWKTGHYKFQIKKWWLEDKVKYHTRCPS